MGRQPKRETLQVLIDDALAQTPPGRTVWVALSGGLDSSLLLALTSEACRQYPRPLQALHVHHGLQRAADDFERHCRQLCLRLGVPLSIERVRVEQRAELGLEGAAREARYAAFIRCVAPGETLWLAQHCDDQAETLLLAALRGSGVRGLASMPAVREWRGRRFERPLLRVTRAQLEAEAERSQLSWIEDPSNTDESLDRNFLRRRVVPLLQTRWPQAVEALAQSAAHAAESDALLEELAAQDLTLLGGDPARLPLAQLTRLSLARRRLLVRHACRRLALPTPPKARLEALLTQLAARRDAQVQVVWPGGEMRLWRDTLYLLPSQAVPTSSWQQEWDGVAPTATPWGEMRVTLTPESGGEVQLRLMPRQGGERLRLTGRGSRDLKRLLQERDVPPWERERVVVVWHKDVPVAALMLPEERWLAVAAGWCATPSEKGGLAVT